MLATAKKKKPKSVLLWALKSPDGELFYQSCSYWLDDVWTRWIHCASKDQIREFRASGKTAQSFALGSGWKLAKVVLTEVQ